MATSLVLQGNKSKRFKGGLGMLQAILLAFKILTLTGYTSVLRKEQSCTHVASLSVNIEPFEKMRKNLSSERTDDIGVNSPWNVVYDALNTI